MDEIAGEYEPSELESKVEAFWNDVGAYEKAKEATKGGAPQYFLDGPPYVSGTTHIGTGWGQALKDLYLRYWRMRGYDVTDRPGFDVHGLPIENKVEQEMSFENKQDILKYGVEPFIERCREFAKENQKEMVNQIQSLGVWMDWENPYLTSNPEYIDAAWWTLAQIHENGLVEQNERTIHWCSQCQTVLANAEVEYSEVKMPEIYVKFSLKNDDASLVVWTTTPWTIPANLYIAVDPELQYARIRAEAEEEVEELIVVKEGVDNIIGTGKYDDVTVLGTFEGGELTGSEYRHPLLEKVPRQKDLTKEEGVHQVHGTDFVEAEQTGINHCAPGHGIEDYEYAIESDLPIFSPVREDVTYDSGAGAYSDLKITQNTTDGTANDMIIDDIDDCGALIQVIENERPYGHCWRCETPVILRSTEQWFVRITDKKEELLQELNETNWYPERALKEQFRPWVESVRDWCISRQRFWGIPIPIWTANDGDGFIIVASRQELLERVDQDVKSSELDFHRPSVDELTITENGTTYERVSDVFDVWFESGVAHLASLNYPDNEEKFDRYWPADFITEGQDQIRGWFWSLLQTGVASLGQVPYQDVLMHGFVLDADNKNKMSKSEGTGIDPREVRTKFGADRTRLFFFRRNQKDTDFKYDEGEIENQFGPLNTIWHAHQFVLQHAKGCEHEQGAVRFDEGDLGALDWWVLSKLQSIEQKVGTHLDDYEVSEALEVLLAFLIDDVSRYYIKTIRSRVQGVSNSTTREVAIRTLANVLEESTRMLAPFVPFISERIYQNLFGEVDTVHALDWPTSNPEVRDRQLEDRIGRLRDIEGAVLTARERKELPLRWPVTKVSILTDDESTVKAVEQYADILEERVSAKEISINAEENEEWSVAPVMEKLGPEFEDKTADVAERLRNISKSEYEGSVTINGESFEITDEMITYEREFPDHVESEEFDRGSVHVDTSTTEDLWADGYANEVVRRIQRLRNHLDLEMDRQIEIAIEVDDDRIEELIAMRQECIEQRTRGTIVDELKEGASEMCEVKGTTIRVTITPI